MALFSQIDFLRAQESVMRGGNWILASGPQSGTYMNWMILFKPSISYKLSVSEPPSSKDSLPRDETDIAIVSSFQGPLGTDTLR